jgi:uncharacterized membrane protein YsdA (DUF1294 family)
MCDKCHLLFISTANVVWPVVMTLQQDTAHKHTYRTKEHNTLEQNTTKSRPN